MARQIIKELHGDKEAEDAENNFEKTVQNREVPQEIKTFKARQGMTISQVLVETESVLSKSEAKRLIDQGGVSIDGKTVEDLDEMAKSGTIKIGKHRFIKIETSD